MTGAPTEPRGAARLDAGGPLELLSERALFTGGAPRRRTAASIARIEADGRLLLVFSQTPDTALGNQAALMLSTSDDSGRSWAEPYPLYALPGWFCMALGGLARITDDDIRLLLGRIQIDPTLGGTEPITGWHLASSTSRDGGRTWSEPGPEIQLFPAWTELYGASNPHPLANGGLLWAAMGTDGRDTTWHAGVSFTDAAASAFSPPVIIAREPGRDYSDIDAVRLTDGRFLAVIREHQTLQSVASWSGDEGRTWSPLRPTPFLGSNIKLFRLRSGAVVCAYRDEDPARRGVSLSWTQDGGESWALLGQLYAADVDAQHEPGSVCGYPDLISLGDDRVLGVLHTYPGPGGIELRCLALRDRTTPAG